MIFVIEIALLMMVTFALGYITGGIFGVSENAERMEEIYEEGYKDGKNSKV